MSILVGDENNILLELNESNRVLINLYGATIISWICHNNERLFLSKKAIFDKKKAIRGGIPIVFPNFGPWEGGRPQHGFARIKMWKLLSAPQKLNDTIIASFGLNDDDETRKVWNFKFDLVYDVILGKNSLKTTLTVKNIDCIEFDFTCLLHTYILVSDINQVKITGLNGTKYLDKVEKGKENVESNEFVEISSEVDRVYKSSLDSHSILVDSQKVLVLKKNNFNDTVLWNPWSEKASKMTDFDSEENKFMVCVEPGCVVDRVFLKPNELFSATQELIV